MKTDITINKEWESSISYYGERIVQKIYQYEKRRKANQEIVVYLIRNQNES